MSERARFDEARRLCDQGLFDGEPGALEAADANLDHVEAELALTRGRVMHIRFLADRQENPQALRLLQRAVELFHKLGDIRGEGEALFRIGVHYQVVRGDNTEALRHLTEARNLSGRAGDKLTLSYAVRHLGFVRKDAGDLEAARDLFEESVRLRSEVGHIPGIAAAKLPLAEVVAQLGDREGALKLLEEARALVAMPGARRVASWLEETRTAL